MIDQKATDKLHWLIYDTNVLELWDLDQLIGEQGWDNKTFLIKLNDSNHIYVKGNQLKKLSIDIDIRNSQKQLFILECGEKDQLITFNYLCDRGKDWLR